MRQSIFFGLFLGFLGFMAMAEPNKASVAKQPAKTVEAKTQAKVTKAKPVSAEKSQPVKPQKAEVKKIKKNQQTKAQAKVTKAVGEGLKPSDLSIKKEELNTPSTDAKELSAKQLRNGFVDLYLFGGYSFYDFSKGYSFFGLSSYFGEVAKNCWIVPPRLEYYMEGGGGTRMTFYGTSALDISVQAFSEINFIKNDGSHNFIPGIRLSSSLGGYWNFDKEDQVVDFGLELGAFYKMFISKRFALIPYVGAGYEFISSDFVVSGQFSLRRYF